MAGGCGRSGPGRAPWRRRAAHPAGGRRGLSALPAHSQRPLPAPRPGPAATRGPARSHRSPTARRWAGRPGRSTRDATLRSAPLGSAAPSASQWRGRPPPAQLYRLPTPRAHPLVTSAAGSQLPLAGSAPRGRGRAAIGQLRSAAEARPPGPCAGSAPRDHVRDRSGPGPALPRAGPGMGRPPPDTPQYGFNAALGAAPARSGAAPSAAPDKGRVLLQRGARPLPAVSWHRRDAPVPV